MGTGASRNPVVGLPMSPRAEFAEKNAPKGEQSLLIDTPALFDLGHGTVRYRKTGEVKVQKPEPKKVKAGYFYQPRLQDYSEEACQKNDDAFKYYFVSKGPVKAKEKKLFYVYGIGMKAEDQANTVRQPYYRPKGKGYVWPSSFRKPNHVYYEVNFVEQEQEFSDLESDCEDTNEDGNGEGMRFTLKDDDSVENLKKRISVRLLIPVLNVHLSHSETELIDNDIVGNLRTGEQGSFKKFTIELLPV